MYAKKHLFFKHETKETLPFPEQWNQQRVTLATSCLSDTSIDIIIYSYCCVIYSYRCAAMGDKLFVVRQLRHNINPFFSVYFFSCFWNQNIKIACSVWCCQNKPFKSASNKGHLWLTKFWRYRKIYTYLLTYCPSCLCGT